MTEYKVEYTATPVKLFCCSECKNDNIQFKVWADEHDVIKGYYDQGSRHIEVYCEDCDTITISEEKEDK